MAGTPSSSRGVAAADVILQTLADAKGDVIGASAADTWARLAVGADDTVLTAASGQATGLKWGTSSSVATDVQTFTANGTWTKPAGVTVVQVLAVGGGGAGMAGDTNLDNSGSGGGGGAKASMTLLASDVGATVAVTVGAGGVGTSDPNVNGTSGGTSSFGTVLSAYGGAAADGAGNEDGGGGGGTGGTGLTRIGGAPGPTDSVALVARPSGGQGASRAASDLVVSGSAEYGGGAGGSYDVNSLGGTSLYGGGGGGAGGNGSGQAGHAGGAAGVYTLAGGGGGAGGAGGQNAGTAGAAGNSYKCGAGGGGGGGSASGVGGAGGAGGAPGGGGGGGGSGLLAGATAGNGARGLVTVISY